MFGKIALLMTIFLFVNTSDVIIGNREEMLLNHGVVKRAALLRKRDQKQGKHAINQSKAGETCKQHISTNHNYGI